MVKRSSIVVYFFMLLLVAGFFYPGMTSAAPAEQELIKNGDLKGLQGWTLQEWMRPASRSGEVTVENDGVKFRSVSGNTRMGIMQTLDVGVFGTTSLKLTARVKADQQQLNGTGWQGREAPVALWVTYTDEQGVLRNGLGSMANPVESQANRMFWHGFYFADPTGNSRNWNGTKVTKGQWTIYQFDLTTLSPKPKIIHAVGAEGSGWSTREGKIASISLKAVLAPPHPPPLNLSGVWNCNDGGKYYIRQIGNKVTWYGEQSPNNPSWSNIAYGEIAGSELKLEWGDVPKGRTMGTGILVLDLSTPGRMTAKQKTGGFGGSVWTR